LARSAAESSCLSPLWQISLAAQRAGTDSMLPELQYSMMGIVLASEFDWKGRKRNSSEH
jgi:hypothetical protein